MKFQFKPREQLCLHIMTQNLQAPYADPTFGGLGAIYNKPVALDSCETKRIASKVITLDYLVTLTTILRYLYGFITIDN